MNFHWALADELVLISLEIYLHMHFRETSPYLKWLAFIEILTVSGLRGDLISFYSSIETSSSTLNT